MHFFLFNYNYNLSIILYHFGIGKISMRALISFFIIIFAQHGTHASLVPSSTTLPKRNRDIITLLVLKIIDMTQIHVLLV